MYMYTEDQPPCGVSMSGIAKTCANKWLPDSSGNQAAAYVYEYDRLCPYVRVEIKAVVTSTYTYPAPALTPVTRSVRANIHNGR